MLLATAFIATTCLASPELTIDSVAPEHTVLVMSLDEVGDMMERVKETPAGENMKPMEDMRKELMRGLPDSMADTWEDSFENSDDFIKMLGSLKMGR